MCGLLVEQVVKYRTLLKMKDVEVTQSERGTISFGYSNHSDAMLDLYLRITQLEESLAKCREQACFSIGEAEALSRQLGNIRNIVDETLST